MNRSAITFTDVYARYGFGRTIQPDDKVFAVAISDSDHAPYGKSKRYKNCDATLTAARHVDADWLELTLEERT